MHSHLLCSHQSQNKNIYFCSAVFWTEYRYPAHSARWSPWDYFDVWLLTSQDTISFCLLFYPAISVSPSLLTLPQIRLSLFYARAVSVVFAFSPPSNPSSMLPLQVTQTVSSHFTDESTLVYMINSSSSEYYVRSFSVLSQFAPRGLSGS